MISRASDYAGKDGLFGTWVAVLMLLCGAPTAWGADASWSAGDGVTPDHACAPWRLATTVGSPPLAGGVMTLDTSAGPAEGLNFTHDSLVLSITYPIEIEFSARYISATTTHPSYTHIAVGVATGSGDFNILHVGDDEVYLWAGVGPIKGDTAFLDTKSTLHTYRMTIQANGDIDVYYDGGGCP